MQDLEHWWSLPSCLWLITEMCCIWRSLLTVVLSSFSSLCNILTLELFSLRCIWNVFCFFWKAILGKLPIHSPPLLNLKCGNHTLWHFLVIFCSQSPNWGRKVAQVSEVTELKLQNIVPLNNFKIWWDPLTQGVCVQTFNLIIFCGVFLFLLL